MKSYCELILGKDIYEITQDDLLNYFEEEQDETNLIEFKSGKVDLLKLCKEICAFLNTEGGIIIVGAPKETKKEIKKQVYNVCQGDLTDSEFPNKDWLYKKIYANITPPPTKLKIQEIVKDTKQFIIEVNQSTNPPHQLNAEGRYYIRIEREAKAAPHGIVQALFNKRLKPQPYASFTINSINDFNQQIDIVIANNSTITAENINGYITIYGIRNITLPNTRSNFTIKCKNNIYDIRFPTLGYLLKGLSTTKTIEIEHYKAPYMIDITLWCKHSELYRKSIIYNPINNEVVRKSISTDENEVTLADLISQVDELNKFNNQIKQKDLNSSCKFLSIYAKENLGNVITIKDANPSQVEDYSKNFIKFQLSDSSGNFGKCFCKKSEIDINKLNFYPKKSFVGVISNEPEIHSYVVNQIL